MVSKELAQQLEYLVRIMDSPIWLVLGGNQNPPSPLFINFLKSKDQAIKTITSPETTHIELKEMIDSLAEFLYSSSKKITFSHYTHQIGILAQTINATIGILNMIFNQIEADAERKLLKLCKKTIEATAPMNDQTKELQKCIKAYENLKPETPSNEQATVKSKLQAAINQLANTLKKATKLESKLQNAIKSLAPSQYAENEATKFLTTLTPMIVFAITQKNSHRNTISKFYNSLTSQNDSHKEHKSQKQKKVHWHNDVNDKLSSEQKASLSKNETLTIGEMKLGIFSNKSKKNNQNSEKSAPTSKKSPQK